MNYRCLLIRALILAISPLASLVCFSNTASAQVGAAITIVDTTPPVVYPPPDLFVGITESGGARGAGAPALAAFLVGAKAKDNVDPNPVALPPQVDGVNADSNTFFPEGSTIVIFSFRDAAGNVGTAAGKVTVIDLQSGDLFVGAASVFDGYGNTVGGIFRVRGGTPTLYCQPPTGDSSDPRFWNIPQDVMLDTQGRVVFVAYLGNFFFTGAGLGLYRCGSLGVTPELLAVFPDVNARPLTDPMPFASMRFGGESGMHMEEVRDVIIKDSLSVPGLVTEDVYSLVLLVGGLHSATGYLKSVRYHPASGLWDDGPDLGTLASGCSNGFQCLMPDVAFHSGVTYVAGGSILRRNKIPLRIDASGTILGTQFQVSLGLFGSAGELNGTILRDSSYPTVTSGCTPAAPFRNDMPLVNGVFRGLSGLHDVIYDEYNGFGLVLATDSIGATAPYLANVSEALLDNPDPSLFFQDSYIGCVAVPALDVSSPLPFFGQHGINTSKHLASSSNGVFGVSGGAIVQMASGVDSTDQAILTTGLYIPPCCGGGLGAWPPKLSAGLSADIIIRVDSPVNVLVTAANGKKIGVDATGNAINDFGKDGFDSGPGEPRFFAINNPGPGSYAVQAIGTGNGPYTIHVYSADFSFPAANHISKSGITSVGKTDSLPFTVDANLNVAFVKVVAIPGDVNGDGVVNCLDLGIVKASFGKKAGQPGFDPRADVNADGVVNILDLSIVARHLAAGTTCP